MLPNELVSSWRSLQDRGPESQEKEWLGTNGKAGDCWIFQGTWVFVGFSLVVANFCRTRRKMALHGLMGEYNFARTVWGMDFLLWGKGPCIFLVGSLDRASLSGRGRILWEDVLCFTGWPERPLKVIAAIARILDKWWFLQRSEICGSSCFNTPQLLKGMDVDVDQHWESEDRTENVYVFLPQNSQNHSAIPNFIRETCWSG